MPRATVQTQNATAADQQQRTDVIRSPHNAPQDQQPKLITAPEQPERKPLLIEDNHDENITRDVTQQHITAPTLIRDEQIPAPDQQAVPTNLSAPEVKDSVKEWEQTQGVVNGADVQTQQQIDTSNRLMDALPSHVLSPTPKKHTDQSFDEHHHGLKDKFTGMAEGFKDRAENIWEGAKHKGEDMKEKAAGVIRDAFHHEGSHKTREQAPHGMISDDEAVRIGKKFDVTDRTDALIQQPHDRHDLLGGVKSFLGHKWHELTSASAQEYRDEPPPARETEEWDGGRQEFEHFDDAQLRGSLQSRQFFEERSLLPRSPLDKPIVGFPAQDRILVERQPVGLVEQRTIDHRPVEVMRGHEIYLPDGYGIVHRIASPHYPTDLRSHRFEMSEPLERRHIAVDEARERSRMFHDIDRQPPFHSQGLFSGVRNFMHDKWDALVHPSARYQIPTRDAHRVREVRNGSPVRNVDVRAATAFQGGPVRNVLDQDFPDDVRSFTDDQGVPREGHRKGVVHRDDHLRYQLSKAKETLMDDFRFLVSPLKTRDDTYWHTTLDELGNKKTKIEVPANVHTQHGVQHREPFWSRAEHRVEHLLGVDRRAESPDVVQRMQAMDQENILERETDLPFAGGRGFATQADIQDFSFRRDLAYPSLMSSFGATSRPFWEHPTEPEQHYGSRSDERLTVVRDRMGDGFERGAPIIKTGITLLTEQDYKRNIDLHPIGTSTYPPERDYVTDRVLRDGSFKHTTRDIYHDDIEHRERFVERAPKETEHRGWFANFRHKSPEKARKLSPARRSDEYDVDVVEDIVAGAPVQRTALQRPEGLHQARAGIDIPIEAREIRTQKVHDVDHEVTVHGENRGVLGNVRNFFGNSWGKLTGAAPVEHVKSGLEKFEDNLAKKVERYEANQFREAKEDWSEGKFSKAHSHASRGHAAENIAEHLRGTTEDRHSSNNKENIPTTPITPGYPV